MLGPTERFSSRVENYVKYRPRYPRELLELLQVECGLTPDALVADVGAGTGFLAELLLEGGCKVIGIEPNAAMREAGERLLAGHERFTSLDGTAEATGLPAQSVDLVTAGQAFHWFEPQAARREFLRILRPGGWIALVWNERRTGATPFLAGYEALLRRLAPEYGRVDHREVGAAELAAFFGASGYREAAFDNRQSFDYEGLCGRVLSSSYAPEPGHPNHEPMLAALRELFDAHQTGGKVDFRYRTRVHWGH